MDDSYHITIYAAAIMELENVQLKIKNIEATNQQLKQQIHPHFLFNSLNTLKSLIKKKPVVAEAFKANGIDYIIKPYTQKNINEALHKFGELRKDVTVHNPYDKILKLFEYRKQGSVSSLLVHYKDKILPMRIAEIALFYIENEITYLLTFDQKKYALNYALGEIEKMAGKDFYRASRQYLVNRRAIKDAST